MTADDWLLILVGSGFGLVPMVILGTIIMWIQHKFDPSYDWKWWNDNE